MHLSKPFFSDPLYILNICQSTSGFTFSGLFPDPRQRYISHVSFHVSSHVSSQWPICEAFYSFVVLLTQPVSFLH